jgi:hypothetical protein
LGKHRQRKTKPLEEKESYKWLQGLEATTEAAIKCPNTQVVHVADREADVYDLLARSHAKELPVLIRGVWDRCVEKAEETTEEAELDSGQKYSLGKLWDVVQSQPVQGEMEVAIPGQTNRPARDAVLEIRFAQMKICPPKRRPKSGSGVKLLPIPVWVVLASESAIPQEESNSNSDPNSDPNTDSKPPSRIIWLLLSTFAVRDYNEACRNVRWYSCRWTIEMFHRVLKSGCGVEERHLRDVTRLQRNLAIDSIVAYRILCCTMLARPCAAGHDLPCTVLFEPFEWKALYCYHHKTNLPPSEVPPLYQMVNWIAHLGGHYKNKPDQPPGTKTLWLGFQRLADISNSWLIFNPDPSRHTCG